MTVAELLRHYMAVAELDRVVRGADERTVQVVFTPEIEGT